MSNDKKAAPQADIKPDTQSEVAKAVSEALKEAIPAAMAAALQVQAQSAQAMRAAMTPQKKERCNVCRQKDMACKGEHRMVALYPTNKRFAKFYEGVTINGVVYRSQNPNHYIEVPADSNVEYLLAQWEKNEDEMVNGRVAEHDAGSIGPGASGHRMAVGAWR
jgi:hypothetical protein